MSDVQTPVIAARGGAGLGACPHIRPASVPQRHGPLPRRATAQPACVSPTCDVTPSLAGRLWWRRGGGGGCVAGAPCHLRHAHPSGSTWRRASPCPHSPSDVPNAVWDKPRTHTEHSTLRTRHTLPEQAPPGTHPHTNAGQSGRHPTTGTAPLLTHLAPPPTLTQSLNPPADLACIARRSG